jgi:hypothetical protein
VVTAAEAPAGVRELKLDGDFVLDDLVTVLLPNATTVVAVEADTEVVVIVLATVVPVTVPTTAVKLVVIGAPPGSICMASRVGEARVAGSIHCSVKSPTKPGAQQK